MWSLWMKIPQLCYLYVYLHFTSVLTQDWEFRLLWSREERVWVCVRLGEEMTKSLFNNHVECFHVFPEGAWTNAQEVLTEMPGSPTAEWHSEFISQQVECFFPRTKAPLSLQDYVFILFPDKARCMNLPFPEARFARVQLISPITF